MGAEPTVLASLGGTVPLSERRRRAALERRRVREGPSTSRERLSHTIDRLATALGVDQSVSELAAVIASRAVDEDIGLGRSVTAVGGASLYVAAQLDGAARHRHVIARVCQVDPSTIDRTARDIVSKLNLDRMPVEPPALVTEVCSALDLDGDTEAVAYDIVSQATERGLHAGKSSRGVAAAGVYLASRLCGTKRTQMETASAANTTQVTLRSRYHELVDLITDPAVEIDGVDAVPAQVG